MGGGILFAANLQPEKLAFLPAPAAQASGASPALLSLREREVARLVHGCLQNGLGRANGSARQDPKRGTGFAVAGNDLTANDADVGQNRLFRLTEAKVPASPLRV
jgi:hypothetical protein